MRKSRGRAMRGSKDIIEDSCSFAAPHSPPPDSARLRARRVAACGVRSPFKPQPDTEEEIYLALDGTATVNVNASIASLVALRGVVLPTRSAGAFDRAEVRRFFEGAGAR